MGRNQDLRAYGLFAFRDAEEEVELSDRRELLYEAMERLDDRSRQILEMWMAETPNKDIAVALGVSGGRVSQLLQNIFAELRGFVSEKEPMRMSYGM